MIKFIGKAQDQGNTSILTVGLMEHVDIPVQTAEVQHQSIRKQQLLAIV